MELYLRTTCIPHLGIQKAWLCQEENIDTNARHVPRYKPDQLWKILHCKYPKKTHSGLLEPVDVSLIMLLLLSRVRGLSSTDSSTDEENIPWRTKLWVGRTISLLICVSMLSFIIEINLIHAYMLPAIQVTYISYWKMSRIWGGQIPPRRFPLEHFRILCRQSVGPDQVARGTRGYLFLSLLPLSFSFFHKQRVQLLHRNPPVFHLNSLVFISHLS